MKKEAVLKMIDELVEKYKYKPLPKKESERVRKIYKDNLPDFLEIKGCGDILLSKELHVICNGYERIVIGDYGAYVEFDKEDANYKRFIIPKEQIYRLSPRYKKNVKYLWYTIEDELDGFKPKIYRQLRTVSYADYIVGKFYVSVYDVTEDIPF